MPIEDIRKVVPEVCHRELLLMPPRIVSFRYDSSMRNYCRAEYKAKLVQTPRIEFYSLSLLSLVDFSLRTKSVLEMETPDGASHIYPHSKERLLHSGA